MLDRAKRELGENSPAYEVYIKKIGKPRVFGIDAYDALQGIVHSDGPRLEKSRFPLFQDGLRRFLNEDRGAIVLQVPVNRILAAASEILMTARSSQADRQHVAGGIQHQARRRHERTGQAATTQEGRVRRCGAAARSGDRGAYPISWSVWAIASRPAFGIPSRDCDVTDEDVSKGQAAAEKVEAAVNVQVRKIVEQEMDRVAAEVNRTVAQASDQLQKLTTDMQETVKNIAVDFYQLQFS